MNDSTLREAGFKDAELPLARLFFDTFTFDETTEDWIKI